eukprot:gb/GECG01012601.1/.p1 GENE.gb/GECG01012601.1/~~gb/GECG01012601.1/.p1  ORF type:complete len:189 (+),score=20.47 gb/GECG01012601.1/:1-567(+)
MALKGITRSEDSFADKDFSNTKIGVIYTQWNKRVIDSLVVGCINKLVECRVQKDNIVTMEVPGAYELTYAADRMARKHPDVEAIICIGCLIKGDTMHFEYIASAVSHGLTQVSIKQEKPILFGVLTCLNEEQAKARAGLTEGPYYLLDMLPEQLLRAYTRATVLLVHAAGGSNHGPEWALSALQMTVL